MILLPFNLASGSDFAVLVVLGLCVLIAWAMKAMSSMAQTGRPPAGPERPVSRQGWPPVQGPAVGRPGGPGSAQPGMPRVQVTQQRVAGQASALPALIALAAQQTSAGQKRVGRPMQRRPVANPATPPLPAPATAARRMAAASLGRVQGPPAHPTAARRIDARTLREQLILTEALQPPLALREPGHLG